MADLFNTSKQNISLHLQNVFADQELLEISVVKDSLTTASDGKSYQIKLYNLDAILAVGFRVRSPRGVQTEVFQQTTVVSLTSYFIITAK